MKASLVTGWPVCEDRRAVARATRERRNYTPLNSWLRRYGPLVGMALMGLSAAAVVFSGLFYAGV